MFQEHTMIGNQTPPNVDFVATLEANGMQRDMLTRELAREAPLDQASRDANARIAAASVNLFGGFASSHHYQKTFENETTRLFKFVNEQQEGIELHAKALFKQANELATGNIHNVQDSFARVQDFKQSTHKIVDDSIALQDFFSNNRKALLEQASVADNKLRGAVHCVELVTKIMPRPT